MVQRITELAAPPVIGQRYLVPTVLYPHHGLTRAWPVAGVRHEDADHLNFPAMHYHLDPRFIPPSIWRGRIADQMKFEYASGPMNGWRDRAWRDQAEIDAAGFEAVARWPLANRLHPDHPEPVWRVLTCYRQFGYEQGEKAKVREAVDSLLTPHYAGHVCKAGSKGFICPHRGMALGTVPIVDGVQTCPLHGLRINAATGKVLAAGENP